MSEHPAKEIIVFPAFYPPHIGGMEFFAHELNLRLARSGQKVTVFFPVFSGTQKPYTIELTEGLEVIHYPAFEIISNFPCPKFWRVDFWNALQKIADRPADIVLSHTRFFITSFLALCFARIKRIPLLHIEHGSSAVQSQNVFIAFIASVYDNTLGSFVIRRANKIVAISAEVSDFIQQQWAIPSTVIRRGFDLAPITAIPASKVLPRTNGIFRLMYIGRLISGKGLDTLLAGLEAVPEKNWELIIIGDGPARQSLEETARKFASNKIFFLGKKAPRETIALLKTTDIFINPSRSEGLPTTVAEAALCGKAIVATDVGGTRELFPEPNQFFLIPANDPLIIADRISKLMQDPDLITTTGNTAKEFVASEFTWDKPIKNFLSLLESLTYEL